MNINRLRARKYLLIADLPTHLHLLTFGVFVAFSDFVVDSYGVTVESSCGDELLNGSLERS